MASGLQVGEFPTNDKKIKRAMHNPMDRATIVSILPVVIEEIKPTVYPGRFLVAPGSVAKPAVLTIGPSVWYSQMPNDGPINEITHSAVQMADSIIRDYCNGMLGCDMDARRPGLFFISGEVSAAKVSMAYASELSIAESKQRAWFAELVKQADNLWARSNNDPMVIWDMMRIAAVELGMTNKDWLRDTLAMEKVKCIGCGFLRDPNFPICPTCKLIDQAHPLAKDLKFAQ